GLLNESFLVFLRFLTFLYLLLTINISNSYYFNINWLKNLKNLMNLASFFKYRFHFGMKQGIYSKKIDVNRLHLKLCVHTSLRKCTSLFSRRCSASFGFSVRILNEAFLSGRSLRTFPTFYFAFTHYNECNPLIFINFNGNQF